MAKRLLSGENKIDNACTMNEMWRRASVMNSFKDTRYENTVLHYLNDSTSQGLNQ